MPESPLVRQVDLRTLAPFARTLVGALRTHSSSNLARLLQGNIHGHCPQCQFRLLAEDVLALAAPEAPDPAVSPKLHRLAQGFCGRQGCEALYYQLSFESVEGLDWNHVLAEIESSGGPPTAETAQVEQELAARKAAARKRTRLRVALGIALVLVLLGVRHVMTGGTIPFIREARRFTADPATVPRLGETNVAVPMPAEGKGTETPRFRAAPEPGRR